MKPQSNPFLRSAALAAITLAASASSAFAVNGWWNTTDGEWTNVNNWWTTVSGTTLVGTVPTTGQTATFNGTGVNGAQTVYLNGNQAASTLTFANTGTTTLLGGTSGTPAANTLTLSGGITVNLGAGAVTFGNTSGTAAANLAISASQNFNNVSSNVVTVNSGITSSAASGTQTLSLNNGGGSLTGFTFNGVIANGLTGGTLALSIPNTASSAVYTFNNTNTFTGGFTISQAGVGQTVNLGANNALGAGLVTFSSGGGGGLILLQATGGAKTLTNNFILGASKGSFAGSNSLAVGGNFNANSTSFASSITGGALTLSGDFYLSNTDIASQTATLAGTGNTLISGVIKNNAALSNTNASNLTISNTGITTLASANTYTGTTTLSGAVGSTIAIGNNSAFNSGNISITGSPTLVASGADRTISNTIINNGSSRTLSVSGPNTLTLAGAVNLSEGASNRVLTLAGYGNTNITGVLSNASSTGSALTISNIGTTTLTGSNTYTGVTIINGGTTKLDFANAAATDDILYNGVAETTLTVGGHLQLVGKAGVNNVQNITTLITSAAGKVTLSAGSGGTMKLQATGVTSNTSTFLDFNIGANSTVNISGAAAGILGSRFTVNDFTDFASIDGSKNVVAAGANITATVAATGPGSGSTFYKLTDGLIRISDNFLFKGIRLDSTGVTDGTLNLGGFQLHAPTTSAASFLYGGGGTNNYNISNGTLTSSSTGAAEFAFGVTTGATLNITSNAAIDNNGAGLVSILKAGGGTLKIDGAKNYTGVTRVFGGILEVNSLANGSSVSGIGASANIAANLRFDGGTLKYTGGVTATDRSFTIDSDGATIDASGTGALTWAPAAALTYNSNYLTLTGTNTAANTFGGGAGVLADSGTVKTVLTKSGIGKWVIAGNHTYSGETFVNAGTLEVAAAGTINSSKAINVAAGAKFLYNSSTALTKAPTLSGNGIANRAVLGGTGPIGVAVTLDNVGDVISPGNSPGVLEFQTGETWAAFSYDWEVNDFSAATGLTAGSDFDQIAITGALALTGSAVNSYYLNVLSLTAGNVSGLAENFSEINRSWNILTTTEGITGFNASYWTLNTTGFTNLDGGAWSIDQTGNNLVLSYAAVPEPNIAALLGGLGMLVLLRRRRA